jgi:hypothetical protein
MRIIYSGIFLIVAFAGAFLSFKSYNRSKVIFFGLERRVKVAIANAALSGFSFGLVVFGIVYSLGLFTDPTFILNIPSITSGAVIFIFILGLVIFLMTLFRYFTTAIFRDRISSSIIQKAKEKNP